MDSLEHLQRRARFTPYIGQTHSVYYTCQIIAFRWHFGMT